MISDGEVEMVGFKKGQLVTICKPQDTFYNIVGKITEIRDDELIVDFRYIKRSYKYFHVKPIIEGTCK